MSDAQLYVDSVAAILSALGSALAVSLASAGSAYATYNIGNWILANPDGYTDLNGNGSPVTLQKYFVGVIISGILSIYGLIVSVLLNANSHSGLTIVKGANNLGAGLAVGLCCLVAGYGIGNLTPSKTNFRNNVLVWVFLEALGLYGLIVALIMQQ
eukprot:TRINITY_DN8284_c0_g1_i1.p1 TRINITY_DN8284_c0_g1~~TRINITY_DN8284_c0_g1_i1.p1  ORF type:complete len:156 (+),score=22.57 TRINITY_DN8284_c0_g1_i1:15-482(+)